MQIEMLLKNKNALLIPVYSARSYETGEYDLAVDGNVAKYTTKIIKSEAKRITILYPINSINLDVIKNIVDKNAKCEVTWLRAVYGKNAKESRNAGKYFYSYIQMLETHFDIIVSEINTLAILAAENKNEFCDSDNFLYWVGTHNTDGTRWDADGHSELNEKIAKNINTACLLPKQVDLLKGKSFYDNYVYEPKYFDKQIIFFPYRLSDSSYKLDVFKKAISELLKEGINNFVVLYTDTNDSHLLDNEDKNVYVKTEKNRYSYLAILKGKPIIPFLDDLSVNHHSNIFEFEYYGCKIIMQENDNIKIKNAITIKNDSELKIALKNALSEGDKQC